MAARTAILFAVLSSGLLLVTYRNGRERYAITQHHRATRPDPAR
ncbi:hypothetical protein [Umezawaea sp. Da 62-37]|nr:hypothetical protein [Umezawaea sp. Da 62-37]WNV92192.1 hypothetical protein RM788_42210 [Umezawaea sp. Da 62-37]